MGYPKALLPFGVELMLHRVLRILAEAADPLIVVAASEQELPPLPEGVHLARDRHESRGPLEGIAAGLRMLAATSDTMHNGQQDESANAAFVTSCDVPLLKPVLVRRMMELSAGYDIAVPRTDGYFHPLAAVYRGGVLPHVERLLAEDRLRPAFLFDCVRTRVVAAEELTDVDPQLESLRNCNRPSDYLAALRAAGLVIDEEVAAAVAEGN